ncbi:hypothetical protein FIBSPDRAFT_299148 [Athelia psychrophila]|uniref:Uncharacterized protein n=1 Tax=Athelia psychrophila TaxID=1759441 RepID=A0A166QVB6_9AGAM|nr:hypothetical protein FIBSPDRAFT_299148 [Fibularhizoctonia sp. CBS 109695]
MLWVWVPVRNCLTWCSKYFTHSSYRTLDSRRGGHGYEHRPIHFCLSSFSCKSRHRHSAQVLQAQVRARRINGKWLNRPIAIVLSVITHSCSEGWVTVPICSSK